MKDIESLKSNRYTCIFNNLINLVKSNTIKKFKNK